LRRQSDESYVLETRELGEADLIVTLFSENWGKLRGVAAAARRSRKRFGGLLEPLTRVRAIWLEKEGRELHRLESMECLRSFVTMQGEPELQATCAVISEVTETFVHEGQADPTSFRLLGAVLEALDSGGDARSLVRYFEYWVLRVHGLLPDLSQCAFCGESLGAGSPSRVVAGCGLCCPACRPGDGLRELSWSSEDRAAIDIFARRAPAEVARMAGVGRGASLELLLRGALESFAERRFRSYRHLGAARASGARGVR
jgi:DNA repair protein RecO (recombination protein O)